MSRKTKKPIRYYSPKRRAIYAQGEQFTHLEIFERDNWTCHLCDEPIDRRLRQPSWWCATIDHIVPVSVALAMGWPPERIHCRSNVRAAHNFCNSRRSNSVLQESGLDQTA